MHQESSTWRKAIQWATDRNDKGRRHDHLHRWGNYSKSMIGLWIRLGVW